MDSLLLAQWLTAIGTIALGIGTFALAVAAVFQQRIWGWLQHPVLDLTASVAPPDCQKTRVRTGPLGSGAPEADCYYLRIRVANNGNAPATRVELLVSEVLKREDDGAWSRITSFLPLALNWSHEGTPIMPIIHRHTEKLCDLGHMIDPKMRRHFATDQPPSFMIQRDPSLAEKVTLSLDTQVAPMTFSHIIAPGTYRIALVLAATETDPVRKTLEIGINGAWHDTELIMLGDLVTMHIIP